MKSKSFTLKDSSDEKPKKANKTFAFVGLYQSAAERNVKLLAKRDLDDNTRSTAAPSSVGTPKRGRSPSAKKKKVKNEVLGMSFITIDGNNLQKSGRSSPVNAPKVTSTPNPTNRTQTQPKVKSIMKTANSTDNDMETSSEISLIKPKKRNKSVSFALEDAEQVAVKKSKSNESLPVDLKKVKVKPKKVEIKEKKLKKLKKKLQEEKENADSIPVDNVDARINTEHMDTEQAETAASDNKEVNGKKKKSKKIKKRKKTDETETESNNNDAAPEKIKKQKNKKHQTKVDETEPISKVRKTDVKPELITEDLGNLSIGDNAFTLTNLLDEMTVVDKDKKKKPKRKKDKVQSAETNENTEQATDDVKEKVIWKKRWNKDKKADTEENLNTSVIVDNLPLGIMCSYKKTLTEHFADCGAIKYIGIAEVYPTHISKPVFTTTLHFNDEESAQKALERDQSVVADSRIGVRRPLARARTTLVLRSYGALSEQALSSAFAAAGRLRAIRLLAKGKKSMGTAFMEFDGPDAVSQALLLAADVKIGGKRVHAARFDPRRRKEKNAHDSDGSDG